ncbi:hypothetical protein IU443_09730 [Nocardia farcinica]|uniref:Uncharacterized protein n=2 Tax=Nocardia farcinica TaxID=37329 RepID=Q5Z138_NOCFA|nr:MULTISPECIES: hypothetical protein [Nocardia]AXK86243.1 hypothetical protein DXT66_11995 [Nocardia farcinica]MBA4857268.1 hypothetical protein [Nocardia farcinica]MBC9817562.1 hypothetical protein [Nocardia farcinica]MBF6069588.1 hypothetical protein [Nocardia farcinica]MBF6143029.1 hypothetical protein [Nocardia farcinica]
MRTEGPDLDLVAAVFADDLGDTAVDLDTLRRIHAGEFGPWAAALEGSGLFDKQALERIVGRWRRDPRTLLDALLADADDVTRRRWAMAWSALERPEPVSRIG